MSSRSMAHAFARPAESLTSRQWFTSLACVLSVSAAWGVFMHSVWVTLGTATVGIAPMWWATRAHETFANRFRFSLLAGGLVSAVQLAVSVFGG